MGYGIEISQPGPQLINTTTTTTATTTAGREAVMVGLGSKIEVDVSVDVDGEMTKTNRNTGPPPTLAVLSNRRVMINLMVKVIGTDLVDLKESRGSLTAAVKSHIKLLIGLFPPYVTNNI